MLPPVCVWKRNICACGSVAPRDLVMFAHILRAALNFATSSNMSLCALKKKEIKEKNPCMDCKIWYPYYVMDFDHVRGRKHKNVAELIDTLSKKKIDEEIAKCEIVCSNCHRIRTHDRLMKKKAVD